MAANVSLDVNGLLQRVLRIPYPCTDDRTAAPSLIIRALTVLMSVVAIRTTVAELVAATPLILQTSASSSIQS